MWRRNAFPVSQDSDQSISEEEDGLDGDCIENTISLGGPAGNKEGVQVMSHLKILTDTHELDPNDTVSILSHENLVVSRGKQVFLLMMKLKILFPIMRTILFAFQESRLRATLAKDSLTCHHWIQSYTTMKELFLIMRHLTSRKLALLPLEVQKRMWVAHGLKQVEKTAGGSRTKAKPKLLFHFQSHKKDQSRVFNDGKGKTLLLNFPMPSEISTAAHGDMNKVMAESQLIFHEKESEQLGNVTVPSELAHKHDSKEHSVAEFLDCLQERSGLMREKLTDVSRSGRIVKMVKERSMTPLGGHGNLDDDEDDLPEALDSGPPTPSDDENLLLQENPECLKPNICRRTMADQFHDAFGTMSALDGKPHFASPRASCGGLFGKLQQVMQREKERDSTYVKNLSAEASSMVEKSISVRILSRSLEAKLTVCSCNCLEDEESSILENDFQMITESAGRILTVIFSSRICSDVELELGNLIHIHPPWKEVKVKGKDEIIILCSYFSQIQS